MNAISGVIAGFVEIARLGEFCFLQTDLFASNDAHFLIRNS